MKVCLPLKALPRSPYLSSQPLRSTFLQTPSCFVHKEHSSIPIIHSVLYFCPLFGFAILSTFAILSLTTWYISTHPLSLNVCFQGICPDPPASSLSILQRSLPESTATVLSQSLLAWGSWKKKLSLFFHFPPDHDLSFSN